MPSSKLLERDVQRWLAFILKGRREEVLVDIGRLDIIVRDDGVDYVVEVKRADYFLSAIGQITGYVHGLDKDGKNIERVKIIALFRWKKLPADRRAACEDICRANNIRVWWIDEDFLQFLYDLEHSRAASGKDIRPASYFLDQFTCKKTRDDTRLEFQNRMIEGLVPEADFVTSSDEEADEESVLTISIDRMAV